MSLTIFRKAICLLYLISLPIFGYSQISLHLNGWGDLEVLQGQEGSHFYYNEIHKDLKDFSIQADNINLLLEAKLSEEFSINLRAQMSRAGASFLGQFSLPLANVSYKPSKKNWGLTLGSFITPFGSFAAKQHPKERTFINLPLAYGYYNKIFPRVGFSELTEEKFIQIDGRNRWGSTLNYYGAYSLGGLLNWSLKPDLIEWQLALTTHASNISINFFDKSQKGSKSINNFAVVSRLKLQPKYFWEQGVSISYGSFFRDSEKAVLFEDQNFTQLLFGTDYNFGFGFWEIFGEATFGLYNVPYYQALAINTPEFVIKQRTTLTTFTTNLNIKYEMPFLSGLYAAYGIDFMSFGANTSLNSNPTDNWDNNVTRHNIAFGYKITSFLLLRTNYMLQSVENRDTWELNTWRTSLTLYW